MNVDVKFNPKEQSATLEFKLADFKSELNYQECLGIVVVFCSDFYLDPELGTDDIKGFIAQGKEANKDSILFDLSEEGLELEFK